MSLLQLAEARPQEDAKPNPGKESPQGNQPPLTIWDHNLKGWL